MTRIVVDKSTRLCIDLIPNVIPLKSLEIATVLLWISLPHASCGVLVKDEKAGNAARHDHVNKLVDTIYHRIDSE